jgi:hypothetical protein
MYPKIPIASPYQRKLHKNANSMMTESAAEALVAQALSRATTLPKLPKLPQLQSRSGASKPKQQGSPSRKNVKEAAAAAANAKSKSPYAFIRNRIEQQVAPAWLDATATPFRPPTRPELVQVFHPLQKIDTYVEWDPATKRYRRTAKPCGRAESAPVGNIVFTYDGSMGAAVLSAKVVGQDEVVSVIQNGFLSPTGEVLSLQSQQDVDGWIRERRRRWPTAKRSQEKQRAWEKAARRMRWLRTAHRHTCQARGDAYPLCYELRSLRLSQLLLLARGLGVLTEVEAILDAVPTVGQLGPSAWEASVGWLSAPSRATAVARALRQLPLLESGVLKTLGSVGAEPQLEGAPAGRDVCVYGYQRAPSGKVSRPPMPPPKAFEDSATKPSKADELLPGHRRTQSSQSNSSSSSAGGGRRGGKKHRRSGSSKSGSGSSSSSAGLSADYGEVIFSFAKGQGLKQEAKARARAAEEGEQGTVSPPSPRGDEAALIEAQASAIAAQSEELRAQEAEIDKLRRLAAAAAAVDPGPIVAREWLSTDCGHRKPAPPRQSVPPPRTKQFIEIVEPVFRPAVPKGGQHRVADRSGTPSPERGERLEGWLLCRDIVGELCADAVVWSRVAQAQARRDAGRLWAAPVFEQSVVGHKEKSGEQLTAVTRPRGGVTCWCTNKCLATRADSTTTDRRDRCGVYLRMLLAAGTVLLAAAVLLVLGLAWYDGNFRRLFVLFGGHSTDLGTYSDLGRYGPGDEGSEAFSRSSTGQKTSQELQTLKMMGTKWMRGLGSYRGSLGSTLGGKVNVAYFGPPPALPEPTDSGLSSTSGVAGWPVPAGSYGSQTGAEHSPATPIVLAGTYSVHGGAVTPVATRYGDAWGRAMADHYMESATLAAMLAAEIGAHAANGLARKLEIEDVRTPHQLALLSAADLAALEPNTRVRRRLWAWAVAYHKTQNVTRYW